MIKVNHVFKNVTLPSLFIVGLVLMLSLSGCTTATRYQAVNKTPLASTFSPEDQQQLALQLADQITNSPIIKVATRGRNYTLLVSNINNKTSEHIDTESIADTLQTGIIQSGLFRVINRSQLDLLKTELELQQAGISDTNTATKIGKMYGAKFVLYGNFSSIVNYINKNKNTYYKLTLKLQDIETGEIIWMGEASLNKYTS